jgi:hypothetical protein
MLMVSSTAAITVLPASTRPSSIATLTAWVMTAIPTLMAMAS